MKNNLRHLRGRKKISVFSVVKGDRVANQICICVICARIRNPNLTKTLFFTHTPKPSVSIL